jgi:hypothetical protein
MPMRLHDVVNILAIPSRIWPGFQVVPPRALRALPIMKRILSVVLTGEKLARGRMLGVSTADRIH